MASTISKPQQRRLISGFTAGALVVLLAVDPFGMGPLVTQLTAAVPGDGSLSRTERVDAVIDGLGLESAVAAQELVGSWDPLAGGGALPVPAAESPEEDEQVVVLSDEGAGAASFSSASLESPQPTEIDLGGLSVTVAQGDPESTPAAVRLRVAGETETSDAGITGVLIDISDASVTPVQTDPEIELTVSYESFAGLVGGDWSSRLGMVWIPDCEPGALDCRPVPLKSVNDPDAKTVTAVVPVESSEGTAPAMYSFASLDSAAAATAGGGSGGSLAVTAGASGPAGNWGATSLSPSSSWGNAGSTGAFTWSLPLPTPAVASGPTPDLGISYSSAASDGRTPTSNNQSGLIGEGFDLTTGYVERSYVPCMQDETPAANNVNRPSGDLCWGTENATLMFNGSSVELVRDAASGTWRAKQDDGSRIERLTGAWNGGQANEYWKVTTPDGTQYFFGRGQRSATDTTALNSAWTVPVYGNQPGEPCYNSNFSSARCSQVWRWNLEYVVDTAGNSMSYIFKKETNEYVYDLMGNFAGDTIAYTSGGRLDRIEYGTRAGTEASTPAPAKTTFTTSPRCITNLQDPDSFCSASQTSTTANHWPDTPIDMVCTTSANCTSITPTFFDRYRLSAISTSAYDGSAYQPVDSWAIAQEYVAQGTGVGIEFAGGVMLVAKSITHTGHNGTASPTDDITLPKNQFGYEFLPNLVESTGGSGQPTLWRPRVANIRTESGASVTVDYRTECAPGDVPGTSETAQKANTRLCYPVKWFPNGDETEQVSYFHKYVIESLVEDGAPVVTGDELITGSVSKVTTFEYSGGAAWVKPTGALIKPKEMTYSEFRGFAEVTTIEGIASESSKTRSRYFRGLGGQLTAGPAGHTVTATDDERFQGQVFVGTEFNGSDKVFETVTVPGAPVVLGTSAAGVTSARIPSTTSYGFSYDGAGELQFRTQTSTTSDVNGQVKTIEDNGDVTRTDDDHCTTITYAHESNAAFAASHQVSLPVETDTVAKSCGVAVSRPSDVISNETATYDAAGRALRSESLDPTDGIGHVLSSEVLAYDERGRPLQVADAAGSVSTIAYNHSAGGLLQSVTSSTPDPDGAGPLTPFSSTTTFNPLTGMVVSTTDLNGRVTSGTYDALGRLLTATYPQHAGGSKPSVQYEYALRANGLNSVVTKTLGADGVTQHASVTLYDGMLRPFQSQVEGVDAGADHNASAADRGRMIAHVYYDSAGRVIQQTGQWWAQGVPQSTPVVPLPVPPSLTTFAYDHAGRTIEQTLWVGNKDVPANRKSTSVTSYNGATTLQIPPLGGTPTAAITDASGRTVELREYVRDPDLDSSADTRAEVLGLDFQSTTYDYDNLGQRIAMHDPEGNDWTYEYDWAGRLTSSVDPDAGSTSTTYDILGRVVTNTNGNGETLAYTYDPLGRTTSLRDDSPTGDVRVQWRYDQATYPDGSPVRGQLSSATRYVDGNPYTTSVPRYDKANRPVSTTVTLPDVAPYSALQSRSYTTSYTYAADGQVSSVKLPGVTTSTGAKKLGDEIVTTRFDTASMPSWMSGGFGWGTYVAESRFTADGRPLLADLGNTYGAITSYSYEDGTNRLVGVALDREGFDGTDVDIRYGYDAAGNVTSMKDQPTATAVAGAQYHDNQCFGYDGLRRLEVAWTAGDANCAVAQGDIQSSSVGGIQPYWSEYSYDPLGNRTELVEHGVGGAPTKTTEYEVGAGSPHQITSLTKTVGSTATSTSFTYDDAGNRVSKTVGSTPTTYQWDAEGELSGFAGDADENIYDAAGNRLVRTDASGTTVYLPGGQEIVISGTSVSATRYYSFSGSTVAVRTGAGLGAVTSLVSDRHGSVVASVPNTSWLAASVRRVFSDPFGAVRGGSDVGVPGDHRFLGAVLDAGAGLSLLGARFYDALVGSFISVDPQLDPSNTAQFNAYNYSGNNPLTWSDPSGLDFWSDLGKNIKKAATAVGSFVNKYKAEIAGVVVGIAVGAACTVATGGVGVVGCAVLAGAAGGAVTSLMKSAQTGKFTVGGLVQDIVIGGVIGGLTAGVGTVLGPLIKSGVSAAGAAVKTTLASVVKTVTAKIAPAIKTATQKVQNFFKPAASVKPPSGATLNLSYKPTWTAAQRTAADTKVAALGLLRVSVTPLLRPLLRPVWS